MTNKSPARASLRSAGKAITLAAALLASAVWTPAWSLDLLQAYEAAQQMAALELNA